MNDVCVWNHLDFSDYDYYDTGCGQSHQFLSDGISENSYKFCPYCGKPIIENKNEYSQSERTEDN